MHTAFLLYIPLASIVASCIFIRFIALYRPVLYTMIYLFYSIIKILQFLTFMSPDVVQYMDDKMEWNE